jgi:hypothetical protein
MKINIKINLTLQELKISIEFSLKTVKYKASHLCIETNKIEHHIVLINMTYSSTD